MFPFLFESALKGGPHIKRVSSRETLLIQVFLQPWSAVRQWTRGDMRPLTAFVRCRGYNGLHFTRGIWRGAGNFDRIFQKQLLTNWVATGFLERNCRISWPEPEDGSAMGGNRGNYRFIGFCMKSAALYTLTPANSMPGGRRGRQRLNPHHQRKPATDHRDPKTAHQREAPYPACRSAADRAHCAPDDHRPRVV